MYRQFYDIPKDLYVRKSDVMMRFAVENSEAFKRADDLRMNTISPQLIFFSKELKEHQILGCVAILQGDKIQQEDKVGHLTFLKTINELLLSGSPQLNLMFSLGENYQWD